MDVSAADLARAALARGDLIAAYDVATAAIVEGDTGGTVRHQQVLALARMGDTERAMDLFAAYGLDRSNDAHERAIGARLLKDRALAAAPGPERQRAVARAFEAYHAIYRESGDSFPGINAATLALLAGDAGQSQALARALLADPGSKRAPIITRRRRGPRPCCCSAAPARSPRPWRAPRSAAAAIMAAARAPCGSSPWSPPISA